MGGVEILGILAVVLLVLFAAVLAAAETAFTNLSRAQAKALAEAPEPHTRVDALVGLLRDREETLSPVLLLVLTCHLAAAGIVAALVQEHFGARWVAVALAVQVVVIFVVAEALPKTLALHNPLGVALRLTPLVKFLRDFWPLRLITRGLVWVANAFLPKSRRRLGPVMSDDELIALASAAVEADVIEPEERELIASVLEFGDTVLREVMTPRPDLVSISATTTVEAALGVSIESGFSRLPVYRDDSDDIVAVVHAKRLAEAARGGRAQALATSVGRPPLFVPETKRAESMLREMQDRRHHAAVVIDEYGGTAGLVTLEDLIEELVGEIVDEFDHEGPLYEWRGADAVVVHGRMPLDELSQLVGGAIPEGEWDTIGGYIFDALGHVPEAGETVLVDDMELTVEKIEGRRITQVRVANTNGNGTH
ncbi:MAG: hemolysin family protein [Acidimicrobiales bacterium]